MPSTAAAPPLDYAPLAQRRVWPRAVLAAAVVLIVLGVSYRDAVTAFVGPRYRAWQMARTEAACVAGSAAPGEVILVTDGTANGTTKRDVPALGRFVRTANAATTSPSMGFAGRPSPRLQADAALIDCTRATDADGSSMLRWTTLRTSDDAFVLFNHATRPGGLPTGIGGGCTIIGDPTVIVAFDPTRGAVTVRRVAAEPGVTRLAFEQAGRTDELEIAWQGSYPMLKPGPMVPREIRTPLRVGGSW